jgi:FlaA1/EpsC-like NDP-sugar epimerase
MAKFVRIAILLIVDILIINISYIASLLLRFDFEIDQPHFEIWLTVYAENILPITLITVASFAVCGLYTSMWRYAGTEELFKIVLAAVLATLLVMGYFNFIISQDTPRTMHV